MKQKSKTKILILTANHGGQFFFKMLCSVSKKLVTKSSLLEKGRKISSLLIRKIYTVPNQEI